MAAILDWAYSRDLRPNNDNPARRPNLLPKRKKTQAVRHFAALPYSELPAFMAELRQRPDIFARALELAILTAARPGEILGARWPEFALGAAMWTVAGERMKSGKAHRVPLSGRAVELLAGLPRRSNSELVFPGRNGGRAWPMALVGQLRHMGYPDLTAHGFRASFRTWAGEQTAYARELIEVALAHRVGDATEEAYMRADMIAKRRQLMEAWSDYCGQPVTRGAGDVVAIRART